MEPLFDDGDIVIVHKQDDFENGDNCVVLINGEEATVKKVYKGTTGIELKAVNPYYPPKIFTKEEIKDLPVRVIGVVEKSIRNFKKNKKWEMCWKNNATRHISLTQTLLKVNVFLLYMKIPLFSIAYLKFYWKWRYFIMGKTKQKGNGERNNL